MYDKCKESVIQRDWKTGSPIKFPSWYIAVRDNF